jgi:Kef-type K+ transport system membrane component KefB
MSDIAVAALLAGTILLASTVSIEIGISVALIELLLGVVVGNSFHLDVPSWLAFIGSFAGVVLTFLAGAEVDVPQFRREGVALDRAGELLRALRRRRAALLLRP